MRLRTWLILGYSAVLALASLGLGLGLVTVLGLEATSRTMVAENFRAVEVGSRLRSLTSAQQLVLVKRLAEGDVGVLHQMPAFNRQVEALFDEARALGDADDPDHAAIERAAAAMRDLDRAVNQAVTQRIEQSRSGELSAQSVITPAVVTAFESLRAASLDYYDHHHNAMLQRGTRIQRQSDRLAIAMALLGGSTVLIGVLVSLRLAERLSAPMERLAEAAAQVAQGDFEVRVGRTGLAEADLVAERFDDMTAALGRFHAMNLDRIVAESRRLDQVVAHIDDGLVIFDEHGHIERVNRVASAQLSIEPDVAFGRRLDDVADFPKLARDIRALIDRPTTALTGSNELQVGDSDSPRTLSYSLLPFSDAARLGLILVLRDVTDVRQFERMRTDFVLRASHELRTPITGMRMALGLLQDKLDFPPDSREAELVGTLGEEMQRLVNLITALLDLSRLYSRSFTLQRTPLDMSEFLSRARQRFAPLTEAAGLALKLDVDEPLPVLDADAGALDRVLDNLVGNAVRHTPRGGRIEIGAERRQDAVEVWVADTGEGIAYADRARVFEPFVQASKKSGGVGLGLAMCREIVSQHGGQLRLDSAPGQGAKFTLSLPV
jgi:NtrC-family two-component system sensor histidine kinase KinB